MLIHKPDVWINNFLAEFWKKNSKIRPRVISWAIFGCRNGRFSTDPDETENICSSISRIYESIIFSLNLENIQYLAVSNFVSSVFGHQFFSPRISGILFFTHFWAGRIVGVSNFQDFVLYSLLPWEIVRGEQFPGFCFSLTFGLGG